MVPLIGEPSSHFSTAPAYLSPSSFSLRERNNKPGTPPLGEKLTWSFVCVDLILIRAGGPGEKVKPV